MSFINAMKMGSDQIMVMIDGSPYYVKDKEEQIDHIFDLVMRYRAKPTEELLKEIESNCDPNRVQHWIGNFVSNRKGEVFYKNTSEKLPVSLIEKINYYTKKGYPIKALENFWLCTLANPDPTARKNVYDFVTRYGLPITDEGYFVAYKRIKTISDHRFDKDVEKAVTKFTKENPPYINSYVVIRREVDVDDPDYDLDDPDDGYFQEPEFYTENQVLVLPIHNMKRDDEFIGTLENIYEEIAGSNQEFVDIYSGTIKQKIGSVVSVDRNQCDPNPNVSCSHGLHAGDYTYVNWYGGNENPVMLVLINPMNVVAVPNHDTSKLRTCEYFIMGFSEMNKNGTIKPIKDMYLPSDYLNYEKESLEERIKSEIDPDEAEQLRKMIKIIEQRING